MEGSEGEGELKILVALPFSFKKELLLTSMCFEGYNLRKKNQPLTLDNVIFP